MNNTNAVNLLAEEIQALKPLIEKEGQDTRLAFRTVRDEALKRKVELTMLESLRFDTMHHRHESITEAHQRTFEWIFQDPDWRVEPWSNFREWLETGTGIYWINGKAGSGKSTLMRFILEAQTAVYLKRWTEHDVLCPGFFFWSSGSPEQRSQLGSLRSILHDVLEKHTSLMPVVFPGEWEKAFECATHNVQILLSKWSLSRLKKAFHDLIRQSSGQLRFCFIIDGLDENQEDHEDLAEYFLELSKAPFAKFCLASRPLQIFEDVFKDCPKLRVQDLTRDDIKLYIYDKLKSNTRMVDLAARYPEKANYLVEHLVWKAEGVFLWVELVVKSLLSGPRNRDNISDIQKRLDDVPPELDQLYSHMLDSIDPIYREEGSKIFQLKDAHNYGNLSAETLYVSLTIDLPRVLGDSFKDLEQAEQEPVLLGEASAHSVFKESCFYNEASLLEHMTPLVRTRCGRLLEINDDEVDFIHRTASDYMECDEVWERIITYTTQSGTSFAPSCNLLMSNVLTLKRALLKGPQSLEKLGDLLRTTWRSSVRHAYRITGAKEPIDPNIPIGLLDEHNRVATMLWDRMKSTEEQQPIVEDWITSHVYWPRHWGNDFLRLALDEGLYFYVEAKITPSHFLPEQSGMPLLAFSFLKIQSFYGNESYQMMDLLLARGADSNAVYKNYTIWQWWIYWLHATRPFGLTYELSRLGKEICRHLLEQDVDLDLEVCSIRDSTIRNKLFLNEQDLDFIHWDRLMRHANNTDSKSLNSEVSTTENAGNISLFKERHCLTAVIKDCFSSEEEPHGADELLELIATLKVAREEAKQPAQRRKKKKRKGGKKRA